MRKRDVATAAVAAAGALALLRRARMESLRGESAIVTGASRGLGFAIARALLREGCRVVVCARDEAELRSAAEELGKLGEVIPVVCDVSRQEDVERLVATAMSYFGRVDILVNNAGVIEVGPTESMELDDFRRMMDVMFWGMTHASLAVLPSMKQRRHGRIVNITSIGGKMSLPHLLPYSAAKFAAVGFSEGLHAEMAKDGIVVTTVVPGLMRTGSYRHARFKGDSKREYGWFAIASSMPVLSMNANRAARQIVRAMRRRTREAVLSAPAKIGVRAHGVAPGTVEALLAIVGRLLPRDATRREVEGADAEAYRKLMLPLTKASRALFDEILRAMRIVSRHPLLLARFGLTAIRPARAAARARFRTEAARALFAGCAAHSLVPLDMAGSASFALVMAISAHAVGWPMAKGGSASIINALAAHLRALGGEIRTSHRVGSLRDVPESRAVIFDTTPKQLVAIAGDALPPRYVRRLQRFRYGPGVFKVDWALDGPIPWRAPEVAGAATVHVGGTLDEIAEYEQSVWNGRVTDRPFVLVAQQSLFDDTRAPAGKHTGWAYCHVPAGSTEDMTERIERQVERFAPGFRDRILARHTMSPARYEAYNENLVGGDIAGGANTLRQLIARPVLSFDPYATPNRRLYIGSGSTPPGGGVHGMCGYWAARAALRRVFGKR